MNNLRLENGKRFEELILKQMRIDEQSGLYRAGRSGTQARYAKIPCAKCGLPSLTPRMVPSNPDFEGTLADGRHLLIEAKVCSGASLPISDPTHVAPKQVQMLLERATMNALCILMIHFNPRDLKTKSDPSLTIAVPVHPCMDLWREVERAETKNISRQRAQDEGVPVEWHTPGKTRTLVPDISGTFYGVGQTLRAAQMEMNHALSA